MVWPSMLGSSVTKSRFMFVSCFHTIRTRKSQTPEVMSSISSPLRIVKVWIVCPPWNWHIHAYPLRKFDFSKGNLYRISNHQFFRGTVVGVFGRVAMINFFGCYFQLRRSRHEVCFLSVAVMWYDSAGVRENVSIRGLGEALRKWTLGSVEEKRTPTKNPMVANMS